MLTPLALCRRIGELPHDGQLPILADKHRFIAVVAGTRFGKSWVAGRWATAKMLAPETRGWCTSGTYDLADKVYREVVGIFRRHGKQLGVTIVKASDTPLTQQTLRLSNGSWLATKSADHPDSLDAEGLDFIVDDEAAKHPARILYQHLIPRLTDRRGCLLATTTARGRNWYWKCWMDAEECMRSGRDPEWAAYSGPSYVNPYVFPTGKQDPEWLRLRAQYTRADLLPLFEQEYGGSFAHLQGRIWAAWDPREHVRPLDNCRRGVREWRLVADWGLRNPTCMLIIGKTGDGDYRIVDEVYKTGLTIDQRKAEAATLAAEWKIKQGWGDSEDPLSNEALADVGITMRPAFKQDRDEGILAVAQKFGQSGGIMIASGACPNLEREIENWCWRDSPTGREIEEPVDKDNHSTDALLYGVRSWDRLDGEGEVTPSRVVYGGQKMPDLSLFAIQ